VSDRITTPFGPESTAAEVIAGIDLGGRRAVVTGGASGIGVETARALAGAGAEVTLAVRNVAAGRRTADELIASTGNPKVAVAPLDLADQTSVAAFVAAWHGPLDILVNNAGIMASPLGRTPQGWELQFATNHLGHFALVNRLWPALVADGGARVVSVSSTGHRRSDIRWDDLEFRRGYDKWEAYGQAKTANVLFAVQLDALGKESGVRAFALHPGGIMTPLQRHLTREEMAGYGWLDEDGNPVVGFKTPEQGAATQVWAATSPQLDGLGGVFCEDCEIAEVSTDDAPGVRPYAIDPASAERLWTVSAELTGVNAFG